MLLKFRIEQKINQVAVREGGWCKSSFGGMLEGTRKVACGEKAQLCDEMTEVRRGWEQ